MILSYKSDDANKGYDKCSYYQTIYIGSGACQECSNHTGQDFKKKTVECNKMKERLKVNIWRKKNVVIAEIVEQDESLRGNLTIETEDKLYSIRSAACPDIDDKILYIRGGMRGTIRDLDKDSFVHTFKTEKDAKTWCTNIKELINKINSVEVEEEEEDNDGFVRVM